MFLPTLTSVLVKIGSVSHTLAASVLADGFTVLVSLSNLIIASGSGVSIVIAEVGNPQATSNISVSLFTSISNGSLVDVGSDLIYSGLTPMDFTLIQLIRTN